MRRSTIAVCIAALMAVQASPVGAAGGDPDDTFGGDGKVAKNLTPGFDVAYGVAIQDDGQIVTAGIIDGGFGVARFGPGGSLDPTFGGGDGWVSTDLGSGPDWATDVVVQDDGRIVAVGTAGFTRFAVARYEVDGQLDATFGDEGTVTTNFTTGMREEAAQGVAIRDDGRIVAAGWSWLHRPRFALARYEADGDLDTTFGGDGKVVTNFDGPGEHAQDVAIQGNGKVVAVGAAGFRFAAARYRVNGALDDAFGGDGMVTTDFTAQGFDWANDVAIQPDGRIVVAGEAGSPYYVLTSVGGGGKRQGGKVALARYRTDGSRDPTFGGDGRVMTNLTPKIDTANGVVLQPDGKIVAAGTAGEAEGSFDSRFFVARYRTGGALDPTFGGDGVVRTNFTDSFDDGIDVALQPDGRIVAAGRAAGKGSRVALARYLPA
jgi:uncharacterized delta-60 repeat protein